MPRVSWKVNLAALWFSQLVILAGFQALIPFIPLFIKNEFGVTDPGQLALAVSSFNFFGTMAYAIFNPIWGVLADRFGVKPMLLRGTFLTAVLFPLMAYTPNVFWLVVVRFLSAGCAGTTAASQTMIARNTPDEYQGFAQGVLSTAIWGGAMLGYVVGGLMIHYFNYKVAFWFCGILYILGGIAVLFTRDNPIRNIPVKHHRISNGFWEKLLPRFTQAVWVMLWLFLLMGLVRGFEVGYIALRVEELTDPKTAALWTGVVSAVVCGAAIASGVCSGYLADRCTPVKMLIPVMLISAFSLLLQGWADNLWVFAAGRVLLYIAAGGLQPLLQKILSSVTPARKRGAVFGFASSSSCLGSMAAAVFSGIAMTAFGVSGVFYIGGILFIIGLPLLIHGIMLATRPFVFHRAHH
ncbi:MAG: MFS transporter [Lentisphaeria bacterium]|nr:MFS transporter [Lentisphaeria bacterium]